MIEIARQIADELGIPLSAAMQWLQQQSQDARANQPQAIPIEKAQSAGLADPNNWDNVPAGNPGYIADAMVGAGSALAGMVPELSTFAYGADPNTFTPAPNVAPSRPTEIPEGPSMMDVPGGTNWWGELLGADIEGLPFLAGAVMAPGPGAKTQATQKAGRRLMALEKVWEGVKDPAEAMQRAKARVHLRRDKSGKYVGAPAQVNSPQKLAALRNRVDNIVFEGLFGAEWYNDARGTAVRLAPDDPSKQSLFAEGGAAYSPQAAPPTEVGSFINQHNAKVVTGVDVRPRTQAQADNVAGAYDLGSDWSVTYSPEKIKQGPKTGEYARAKDPTVPQGEIWKAPNDIWQGRVWEYGGKDFQRGFTDQETAFLIGENLRALDRINTRLRKMGMPEINIEQMQAAAWSEVRKRDYIDNELAKIAKQNETIAEDNAKIEMKIRNNLEENEKRRAAGQKNFLKTDYELKPLIEPDMDDITRRAMDYGKAGIAEAVGRHTAHLTGEARTGASVGHLWMDDPSEVKAYSDRVFGAIEGQQQPVLGPLNYYTARPTQTDGFYINSLGEIERNPGYQYDTLVSSTPTSEPVLDDAGNVVLNAKGEEKRRQIPVNMQDVDRTAMDLAALTEGVLHAQEAGAWSRFMPEGMGKMLTGDKNAVLVNHGPYGRGIEGYLENIPYDRVNYGDSTLLTSFDGPVDIRALQESVGQSGIPGQALSGKLESGYMPTHLDSQPGSGRATESLLEAWDDAEKVIPDVGARTADAVAERARAINLVDREIAKETGKAVREDLMKLRDILADGGIPALREWVRKNGTKGLPVAILGLLGYQSASQEGSQTFSTDF